MKLSLTKCINVFRYKIENKFTKLSLWCKTIFRTRLKNVYSTLILNFVKFFDKNSAKNNQQKTALNLTKSYRGC